MPRKLLLVLLSTAVVLGVRTAAFAADVPKEKPPTVSVTVRASDDAGDRSFNGILFREIFRQAFLLSARDELGLSTRDPVLHESIPEGTVTTFGLAPTCEGTASYKVRVPVTMKVDGDDKSLLDKTIEIQKGKLLVTLVSEAEKLSRNEFREILSKQKLPGLAKPAQDKGEVSKVVREQLPVWNEFAQFAAIRTLHAECREKGESPELLAALVIGYANLGSMAEYLWSPLHKVCSARSLLYAERLVVKTKNAPWAVAHRAYARTFAGMHDAASTDVKSLPAKDSKVTDGRELPSWVDELELFADGKYSELAKKDGGTVDGKLAHYLHLVGVEFTREMDLLMESSDRLLKNSPDCFRAIEARYYPNGIGFISQATTMNVQRLPISISKRLKSISDLPKEFREYSWEGGGDDGELAGEVKARAKLIADLKEAGAAGKDGGEMSFDALAHLIEDVSFVHIYRMLEVQRDRYAVQREGTLTLYHPIIEKHRFAPFFEFFSDDPRAPQEALEPLIKAVDFTEVEYQLAQIIRAIHYGNPEYGRNLGDRASGNCDAVFRDQLFMYSMRDRNVKSDELDRVWTQVAFLARSISPNSPVVISNVIDADWDNMGPQLAELEKKYADDLTVLGTLARKYYNAKQFDDAIRVYESMIKIAPTMSRYTQLGDTYWNKGEQERWKEIMLKALELPSHGLEETNILVGLANYHERRKEYKEALPYAEKAAQSYASWAMESAASCYENVGKWKEAEEWVQRNAERYDDDKIEYLSWCHRTGKGDVNAAQTMAREYFESLGVPLPSYALVKIGIYYLFIREPEKAFEVFQEAYRQDGNSYNGMTACLLADQLGNKEVRDQLLEQLIAASKRENADDYAKFYGQFAALLQASLQSEKEPGKLSKGGILFIQKQAPEGETTNTDYFAAWYLRNRGDEELSREFLKRCATSPMKKKYAHALARRELREQKIDIGEIREKEKE